MRGRNPILAIAALLLVAGLASACGSGPSAAALERDAAPATTTTTEPPPEGVVFVRISNGAFRPSNLEIDPAITPVVRWVHEDGGDREYVIEGRRGEFVSETLAIGDEFEFDFSTLEPGIYRYFMNIGQNRVPGSVDTRPNS